MYKPAIGLEVHTQLKTESKMFCRCKNSPFEKQPNIHICPVCLGHPGTLPTANKEAIISVVKAGMALNCSIADVSKFDRKNYFYPDLPKGYQISQYDQPLCYTGYLIINGKKIRITRIHLEEDTGRLVHDGNHSLVDFNRSGVPLMELVTEPDIANANQAQRFAEELRIIFRYLQISDADMEKGQMRVEVNISLSEKQGTLGTKVEIKNLNSFRSVQKSVEYEIERQKELLEKGEKVVQETRGWSEEKQKTFSQREKEEAHDYRYLPEPDIPPIYLNEPPFNKNKISLGVELPAQKRERFKEEYFLDDYVIEILVGDKNLANYFEKAFSEGLNWIKESDKKCDKKEFARTISSYLISDLLGLMDSNPINNTLITPENFGELIVLVYSKEISSKIAKIVLKEMYISGGDPSQIIKEKGLSQINDDKEIEKVIISVIKENNKATEDYKNGKEGVLQFFIGQVMAKTKGRAEPDTVKHLLTKLIKNDIN